MALVGSKHMPPALPPVLQLSPSQVSLSDVKRPNSFLLPAFFGGRRHCAKTCSNMHVAIRRSCHDGRIPERECDTQIAKDPANGHWDLSQTLCLIHLNMLKFKRSKQVETSADSCAGVWKSYRTTSLSAALRSLFMILCTAVLLS